MTKHIFVDEAFAAELLRMRGYVVLKQEEAEKLRRFIFNCECCMGGYRAELALLAPHQALPPAALEEE